jgi:hypothetical protein
MHTHALKMSKRRKKRRRRRSRRRRRRRRRRKLHTGTLYDLEITFTGRAKSVQISLPPPAQCAARPAPSNRGLHSSTSQLNLSRSWHK